MVISGPSLYQLITFNPKFFAIQYIFITKAKPKPLVDTPIIKLLKMNLKIKQIKQEFSLMHSYDVKPI